MNWTNTLGVTLLTGAAGTGAAACLAMALIALRQIPNREGASGYFFFGVTGIGLVGGLVIGLVTAFTVQGGFWKVQGYAAAMVGVLAVIAGLMGGRNGTPTIDGERLVLEVELKCPPGWKPDNASRAELGSTLRLQEREVNTSTTDFVLGSVALPQGPEADGEWLVPAAVDLVRAPKNRFVHIYIGKKADLTFRVPLPSRPGPQHMQWSAWTNTGRAGYAYRFRVQGEREHEAAHPLAETVFRAARLKAMAAMPADAPLAQWLPFFENERGQALAYGVEVAPETAAVRARPDELAPLLRSTDGDTVRRAVFAAGTLERIPLALAGPLAEAGRGTLALLRNAEARGLPDDPEVQGEARARTFFFYWKMAIERPGGSGSPACRAVLQEIATEAERLARRHSDIDSIRNDAQEALGKLSR